MFTQPSKHRVSRESESGRSNMKLTIQRMKRFLSRSSSHSSSRASAPTLDTSQTLGTTARLQEELALTPWYHKSINGRRAMRILEPFPDGSFLLRDSMSNDGRNLFAVTYKSQSQYGNIRIQQGRDKFSLNVSDPRQPRFESPIALLEHVVRVQQPTLLTIGGVSEVVYLQHPVARLHEPKTLQDICKKSIRSHLHSDNGINTLPLPNNLKASLLTWNAFETDRYGI